MLTTHKDGVDTEVWHYFFLHLVLEISYRVKVWLRGNYKLPLELELWQ